MHQEIATLFQPGVGVKAKQDSADLKKKKKKKSEAQQRPEQKKGTATDFGLSRVNMHG